MKNALRGLVVAGLMLASVARSGTIELPAAADSFVTSAQSGNNFGAGGALAVAAVGSSLGEFQSVLRFDTASASAAFDAQYGAGQWSVTSIGLRLTAAAPQNTIFNPSVAGTILIDWVTNDAWIEGTGTPTSPTQNGVSFTQLAGFLQPTDALVATVAYDGSTTATATHALTLGAGLTGDALMGAPISLRLYAPQGGAAATFRSRSFNMAAPRPALVIQAVPEPASWLGVLAMCLVAGRVRRTG